MLKLIKGDIAELSSPILLKELYNIQDLSNDELRHEIESFLVTSFQDPEPNIAFKLIDDLNDSNKLKELIIGITDFLFKYNSKRTIYILSEDTVFDLLNKALNNIQFRKSFLVSGRVQGVFYRQTTTEKASQYQLTGFVQNLENGNVYIEAQGSMTQILSLFEWALDGPTHARVENIIVSELPIIDNDQSFNVKR